ncbi:MAG: Hsp20/alpha crystallin family protein, partial [Nitrosopumilaceae archaeon]|nr:Hsp20/alpha crystallin family protein [Nitrosopumilaceae archaeon]
FVDEIVDKTSNTLKLVAEMPGVDKKDIKVTVEDKYAKISAEHGDRKYRTKIPLKYKVDENSIKATYANGILEVSFRLVEQKPKGKTVVID